MAEMFSIEYFIIGIALGVLALIIYKYIQNYKKGPKYWIQKAEAFANTKYPNYWKVVDYYDKALKLDPENKEAKEGKKKTLENLRKSNPTGKSK